MNVCRTKRFLRFKKKILAYTRIVKDPIQFNKKLIEDKIEINILT